MKNLCELCLETGVKSEMIVIEIGTAEQATGKALACERCDHVQEIDDFEEREEPPHELTK